ncbi:MAG: cadherin repeat domain-containing protein, partial [Planctomycetales bacterium]|nr:cadherin repeat domain-containing protein [Planctomycetales bacterium]
PFSINRLTGELVVEDTSLLDFETTPSFTFTVSVTDTSGVQAVETVTVNLTNVTESTNVPAVGSIVATSATEAAFADDTDWWV